MKTIIRKHMKSIFRILFINMAVTGSLMAYTQWTEGEAYAFLNPRIETAIGGKTPASGGKCLAGVAFRMKGNEVGYDLKIPEVLDDAVLVIRYARLHVMDWSAAPVSIHLKGEGTLIIKQEHFDQTGGWGTNGAEEWGIKQISLGTLPSGTYSLVFRADGEHGDLNMDGFFIADSGFALQKAELSKLDQIHISDSRYWGIGISNKAVEQQAFPDLLVQQRGWSGMKDQFSVSITTAETGEVHQVEDGITLAGEDEPAVAYVPGRLFADIPDGSHDIVVRGQAGDESLSISIVAMGDLFQKAADKAEAYTAYKDQLLIEKPELHKRVGADLQYAVDYIRNTLVLLRSKGSTGNTPEEVRKRALAYMEKSKDRSAGDFANDLRALISQTDETIRRIELGDTRPYTGRIGDFRRAFFSERTGEVKPYRVVVPDDFWSAPENKLLLTLHGGGGDENYYPENDGGSFKATANRLSYMFAAPRAVSRYRDGEEYDMKQLVELLQAEYPRLSPDRTYCTGVSMGGFGTFNMVTHFPRLFRAAACVSSGGGRNLADGASLMQADLSSLEHTPLLIIHGEIDSVVPLERATNLDKALKELGYRHELEIYPGHGHAYYGEMYLNRTHQFFESLDK